MKRQRSRNRKPAGNQQNNNPNRAYESNGPDTTKVRGNAQTIYEKYQQLARDANSSGDRVLAENYLQHAEHYFRLIRQMQPQRPVSEFLQRDPFATGFDFDEDLDVDTSESADDAQDGDAQDTDRNEDQPRYDNRNNRERDNRDRDNRDRPNNDRNRNDRNDRNRDRDNRDRDNRDRDNRDRDNRDRAPVQAVAPAPVTTDTRDADEANRLNGERRESRRERYERRRHQRLNEQEVVVNGADAFGASDSAPDISVAGFETITPQATPIATPVATPIAAPAKAAPEPDGAQLPAFLRTPVTILPDASAPEAEPVKKPRARRKKVDEVAVQDSAAEDA